MEKKEALQLLRESDKGVLILVGHLIDAMVLENYEMIDTCSVEEFHVTQGKVRGLKELKSKLLKNS